MRQISFLILLIISIPVFSQTSGQLKEHKRDSSLHENLRSIKCKSLIVELWYPTDIIKYGLLSKQVLQRKQRHDG